MVGRIFPNISSTFLRIAPLRVSARKAEIISNLFVMKKYFGMLVLALIVAMPSMASATSLTCPEGQMVESVLVTAGSPAIPAVPAWHEYVSVGWGHGDYVKVGQDYFHVSHNGGNYDKVTHPATPAVPAVDPVYADQCVTDPNYVAPVVCDEGSHAVENACVADEQTPVEPPVCSEAQHLDGNTCVDNEITPPSNDTGSTPQTPVTHGGKSGGRRHCVQTTTGWYCPAGAVDAYLHGSVNDQISWIQAQIQILLAKLANLQK